MSLRGRTVLVTGGTGFIGGRLVEKLVLDEGCRVRVLVRDFAHAARISPYPVEMVGGDLRDRASVERAVQGCDVVFHCAYDFVPTLAGQERTGVEGTRNVAEAALAEGVDRMVHLSTMAVYQPLPPGEVTEESPWPASQDPYVLVKREAENLLDEIHRRQGLPAVILQPTIVYGPFSTFWTLTPLRRLRNPKVRVPLLDGGATPCNAVYVDDVADAMLLAATRPGVEGERFLISAEEPVTWKEFYQGLEAAAGLQSTVEVPVEEIYRLRREERKKRSIVHRIRRGARDPRTWARVSKLPVIGALAKVLPEAVLSELAKGWLHEEAPPAPRIFLPSDAAIELETSRGRVRIDRARERLGYTPRFDLSRGMEVTRRYLEWADLVGPEQPRGRPSAAVTPARPAPAPGNTSSPAPAALLR